jgi:hypothetical protein
MVNGRVLLRHGKSLTLDEERIMGEAQMHQDELVSRSGARD